MLFGYNTNGFAHHRLEDALNILADLGYSSVAITLDHHALNPFDPELAAQLNRVAVILEKRNLRCVIETGARFLLDPRQKHQPTLLSPESSERETRFHFLCRAVDIAAHLQADAVSFWSGTPIAEESPTLLWDRLVATCRRLSDYAASRKLRLAFEPEPGMFIDTMERFALLRDHVDHPAFGLTIDIGHLHCQGETPIADHLQRWKSILWNIHIEDMRKGVHDHLMFGEGEIDFRPVLHALEQIGYRGGVHVELSRHSHDAVRTAEKALAFLKKMVM
ncbi:MAG TPA: sugar phosphate isomerase/epimerase family protein [Gemmataceae bacterium]|nr:sugar phosphate isomerase/epimerase family protein [Gemmataceae bacterium]